MNRELPTEYKNSVPGLPDDASLDRVRVAAKAKGSASRPGRRASVPIRLAVSTAIGVAALAVFLWVMAPRVDDSAFARQQAIATLLPKEGVLHTIYVLETERTNLPRQRSVCEAWIDASAKAARDVFKEQGSSEVSELTVRNGNVVRSLGRDGGVNGKARIVQYEAPVELTSPGGEYVDLLRESLHSGEAKVVARTTQKDGDYWVVEALIEHSDKVTGDSTERVIAMMRVGDYRLRQLSILRKGNHPVDGKWMEEISLHFRAWETVLRESLPQGFFDLAEVDRNAPEGTIVEVPPPTE